MDNELSSSIISPKGIKVTLLLQGGHEYTIFLSPEDPLLKRLLLSVIMRSQPHQEHGQGYFQIPIDQGYASLLVAWQDLVGIITQPPITIQIPEADQALSDIAGFDQISTVVSEPATDVIPSPFVQINNILSPDELNHLLDYVRAREAHFVPTQTSTQDLSYRQSLILHHFPDVAALMQQRVLDLIPDVLSKLEILPFTPSQIEAQLTAHNDGNYYKIHNDNGSPDTATRVLTYVYYFYCNPKPFTGGELRIYDSRIENGYYVQAESFQDVEPINNSIVFFPSRYLHEVLPVSCPSQAFADSRFTINGWVRQ